MVRRARSARPVRLHVRPLVSVPVRRRRVVYALAWIPDFVVLNPIQFWGFDVAAGKGAAFQHQNPPSSKRVFFE